MKEKKNVLLQISRNIKSNDFKNLEHSSLNPSLLNFVKIFEHKSNNIKKLKSKLLMTQNLNRNSNLISTDRYDSNTYIQKKQVENKSLKTENDLDKIKSAQVTNNIHKYFKKNILYKPITVRNFYIINNYINIYCDGNKVKNIADELTKNGKNSNKVSVTNCLEIGKKNFETNLSLLKFRFKYEETKLKKIIFAYKIKLGFLRVNYIKKKKLVDNIEKEEINFRHQKCILAEKIIMQKLLNNEFNKAKDSKGDNDSFSDLDNDLNDTSTDEMLMTKNKNISKMTRFNSKQYNNI